MNVERLQGRGFAALALVTVALPMNVQPLLAAVLVLVFGVPHGAFDPVYVATLYRPRKIATWLLFTAIYVAAAAAVVLLWRVYPLWFLVGFLCISAWHFAGDPAAPTDFATRFLYGGAIIVLPALFHGREVTAIMAMLIDAPDAVLVGVWLHRLSPGWLIGLAFLVGRQWRRDLALEAATLALLAVCAPPLVAFTVFFCAMHGARHLIRTQRWLQLGFEPRWMWAAGAAMLALLPLLWLGWYRLGGLPAQTRVVQLLFVGLAALTVPHMVVIERARKMMVEPR